MRSQQRTVNSDYMWKCTGIPVPVFLAGSVQTPRKQRSSQTRTGFPFDVFCIIGTEYLDRTVIVALSLLLPSCKKASVFKFRW